MADKSSSGKIEFSIGFGKPVPRARRDDDTPFCIGVLGDFTGRASRGVRDVGQVKPLMIDTDNFEKVMQKLGIVLSLPHPQHSDQTMELEFSSIEDFHPDQLIQQAEPLAKLVLLRKKLLSPATVVAAAAEVQAVLSQQAVTPGVEVGPTSSTESTEDTMARLLGNAPLPQAAGIPSAQKPTINIESLIKNIVAPSVVQKPTSQQEAALAALDLELVTQLRSILHYPQFQELEAGWRAVDFLVRNLDPEESLKLYVVDISKAELAADLQAQTELQSAETYRVLYGQPWALLVGNYTFDETIADIDILRRMGAIASWLGAPFVAAASPHLIGCESFATQPDPDDWKQPLTGESSLAWQTLRQAAEASSVGLTLPRFLLRQPYGKSSDAIEAFPFEELAAAGNVHERYLWGNAAFLCGYVLAEAFKEDGWGMIASGSGEIGEMPLHQFKEDGEIQVKPCAEAWLTIRAADVILGHGLMPVMSIKGRDAVRLAGLQSIALPMKPLALRTGNNS
ncbi:MAG: hypothetical protein JWR26_3730 [Pedosphaera sp.]|nr:hypothetical protein [Pedosphaera sp.]